MANLIFKYGAMNSGKTLSILQTIDSYNDNNFKVILMKSGTYSKEKEKIISKNNGGHKLDICLQENESILQEKYYKQYYNSKAILIDGVELLSELQVEELWTIAHLINIPIIAYGLKSNFKAEIFSEAIAKIFAMADVVEEIGSTNLCFCGKKAIFNARKVDELFQTDGPIVMMNDKNKVNYIPLCGDCYLKYIKIDSDSSKKLTSLINKIS